MKILRTAWVIGIAAWTVTAAPAADSPAVKQDMAALQGEWSMLAGNADGYVIPEAMLKNSKRICQGDVITVILGGQLIMKATFTLDPSKTPKTVDYSVIDGPTKGKKHLGIYEIAGDTVKYCFGEPEAARPTVFVSKPGERNTLSVWQRQKTASDAEKK